MSFLWRFGILVENTSWAQTGHIHKLEMSMTFAACSSITPGFTA